MYCRIWGGVGCTKLGFTLSFPEHRQLFPVGFFFFFVCVVVGKPGLQLELLHLETEALMCNLTPQVIQIKPWLLHDGSHYRDVCQAHVNETDWTHWTMTAARLILLSTSIVLHGNEDGGKNGFCSILIFVLSHQCWVISAQNHMHANTHTHTQDFKDFSFNMQHIRGGQITRGTRALLHRGRKHRKHL